MEEKNKEYIEMQLTENGEKYSTLPTSGYTERKRWIAPNLKEVLSIIPGSVISIDVKVGDSVKRGDPLMIYEAMKMHNIVVAPVDGTVRSINVKPGDKLPKNYVLLELA
ncbi:MAG: acetyl-CoA carboxylase biotin carboxyl carrier protein subunit [Bacteroidales bacterium]|nr:acetyl-CoA carboxylase biotin carboxyl carrier protein subunit [Bacteroidales bacterium]